LGVVTGILAGGLVFVGLYAAADGYAECIPMALVSLIFPIAFLWLARRLAPAQ
jgi:hypothetical protein